MLFRSYEISGLPAGVYTITFSKAGYVHQTFSVTLVDNQPQRALDVTLRGVNVAIAGSAPNCTAVDVVLRDGRALTPAVTAAIRPDGSYRIPRVYSPGEYRAVFRIGSAPLASANFDLDPGETDVVVDGFCVPPTTLGLLDSLLTTTTTDPPSPPTTTATS